ncbi:MAG: response regulator [Acidobacteria bacterium]|nr:response regulator [Acidobacteriota bacterium]
MAKILCIDDNAHGLNARRILLEREGHTVTVARSGLEGLTLFQRARPDLVVVDYVMPHMNGGEVIREIKRAAPKVPVILLSGYTEVLSLEEKVKEADCILTKSSTREIPELLSTISRLLRKSSKKPAASVKAKAKDTKEKKTAGRKTIR